MHFVLIVLKYTFSLSLVDTGQIVVNTEYNVVFEENLLHFTY